MGLKFEVSGWIAVALLMAVMIAVVSTVGCGARVRPPCDQAAAVLMEEGTGGQQPGRRCR